MQGASDWWAQSAFIRDYFFSEQRKIAHQLAAYLAKYYVGEGVSELRPDTDVPALMSDSIRRFIDQADFTLVRDDDLLADIDLRESMQFRELVTIIQSRRGFAALS
jgi:hypothetical protein